MRIYKSPIQAERCRHAVQQGSLTKQTGQLPLEGASIIWKMSLAQCESENVLKIVFEHNPENFRSCNMHFVIESKVLVITHICLDVISQGTAEND